MTVIAESRFIIFLIIILLLYLNDNRCENCSGESLESCDDREISINNNKYSKEWNEIIENIKLAEKNYAETINTNNNNNNKTNYCSIDLNTIDADLLPFSQFGITKNDIDAIKQYGIKYQIVNNKLYRQQECLFPARCSGIEHFLLENLKQLPNLEMIVNTRDWPQIHKNWGTFRGPVFSFSKTAEYLDIQYPTWSFWEGGPAISLYPTGLGRWDKHRKTIKEAAEKFPWHEKQSQAFFRGSRTSHERDPLILLSRDAPDLIDAQYTKNQAWKSAADTLNRAPAKEIPLEEHCQYKYLFNYRGVAASFRFKHLFLCQSMVFHVGSEWKEFFYDSLMPWIHYVPISTERATNTGDLKMIIQFFQQNDELAKRIALAGHQHIWDHLKMKHIHCYWRTLLKRYAKLLKYTIERDGNLIELK